MKHLRYAAYVLRHKWYVYLFGRAIEVMRLRDWLAYIGRAPAEDYLAWQAAQDAAGNDVGEIDWIQTLCARALTGQEPPR